MELLQWHKVCELGGDKLHRPPVVALNVISTVVWTGHAYSLNMSVYLRPIHVQVFMLALQLSWITFKTQNLI